ncbi:MAG: Na+/glucose cotransporter, partial [Pedobacter sp.]
MGNIVERLTTLDYIIVIAYLVILVVIGYRASFSKGKKSDESLFLANKSLNWSSIGFNMWGTNVGPSMLVAFASIGYATGIVAVNFEW